MRPGAPPSPQACCCWCKQQEEEEESLVRTVTTVRCCCSALLGSTLLCALRATIPAPNSGSPCTTGPHTCPDDQSQQQLWRHNNWLWRQGVEAIYLCATRNLISVCVLLFSDTLRFLSETGAHQRYKRGIRGLPDGETLLMNLMV